MINEVRFGADTASKLEPTSTCQLFVENCFRKADNADKKYDVTQLVAADIHFIKMYWNREKRRKIYPKYVKIIDKAHVILLVPGTVFTKPS